MKVSKDVLIQELVVNKKPISFIMTEYSISRATVIKYLKKLNLYDTIVSNRSGSNIEDLNGRIFGNLTVISPEYIIDKHGKTKWKCRCSCGNELYVNRSSLIRDLTKTCGKCSKGGGFKDVSSTYLSRLKSCAIKRNIEFNITAEDIWNKFAEQDGKCALSGIELSLIRNQDKSRLQSASVDRIDSSAGYAYDNIRIVHKKINLMRGAMNDDEFFSFIRIIYENNKDSISSLSDIKISKSINKYDSTHYME